MKKKEQQKELRKTENIAGNPEKYATKMQCAMHVAHTGSQSHIPSPAPARTPAHTHTHTVTQLVAQILALHILWRLKFLWQFARRATLGRKSQQNAKQSVAQTELLRLNAVRDALKQ